MSDLQGKLVLLLGPPGSGKSTLLKAMTGRLKASSNLQVGKEREHSGWPGVDWQDACGSPCIKGCVWLGCIG